jgi:cytosolic carboxypeptidase protein 2/3
MSQIDPQIFSYKKCTFKVNKGKEGTGRVVMWRLLNIPAVYTMEASLCGGSSTSGMEHFVPLNLENAGKNLCLALLVYSNTNITP